MPLVFQKIPQINLLNIITSLLLISLLTACGSSRRINNNYVYFSEGEDTVAIPPKETTIQPYDLLSIQVYSRTLNQEQAAIFNIPATANSSMAGYQVNSNGNIDMPVIGPVKAAGLTKDQLQSLLVRLLSDNVKNPSVLIRFLQFNVSVLGEVKAPGTQKFAVDKVSIIDAISAAGDLTDYGRRDNVTVIREQAGKKVYHTIDLRSKVLFQSPVYTLQPNDIVYVSPNRNKLNSLSVDPEVQRRTGLLLTVLSVVISISTLVITALR